MDYHWILLPSSMYDLTFGSLDAVISKLDCRHGLLQSSVYVKDLIQDQDF